MTGKHSRDIQASDRAPPCKFMFRFICSRLRGRPDSEHEMSYNRIGLNILAFLFAVSDISFGFTTAGQPSVLAPGFDVQTALLLSSVYLAIGVLIFAHILVFPDRNPARRVFAICVDALFITLVMHMAGERFLWFYPFLLWMIFGNGFRFGLTYLFIASAIATSAFLMLIFFSPFWQRYPALSWGCVVGLVALPAYVSILIRKLSEAISAAEEANRAKSLFLASVSHELRTPLNAIIGLSDLLSDTRMNAEQIDMTKTIGESGRSLLSLINSVLDLSRLEVGKMPITKERLDLHGLLKRIRNIIGVIAEKKGIRLALQIAPDVPQFIMASDRMLDEIVTNLTSNAVKFTQEGYVLIRVRADSEKDGSAELIFEVSDTGIGIAEEAQANIFERFTQADESIVDRFGGTGLGLAIAKQMVDQQGGSIEVSSELGAGSTFTVRMTFEVLEEEGVQLKKDRNVILLTQDSQVRQAVQDVVADVIACTNPAEVASKIAESAVASKPRPLVFIDLECPGDPVAIAAILDPPDKLALSLAIAIDGREESLLDRDIEPYFASVLNSPLTASNIESAIRVALPSSVQDDAGTMSKFYAETSGHILVADDNKTNQKVIGKILEKAGHSVSFADNGQMAVDMLETHEFDLALMDINMPILNGLEAAKLYRFASLGRDPTPIFALTADVTEETRVRCMEAGMDGCLSKPIEPARLLAIVDQKIVSTAGNVSEKRKKEPDESGEPTEEQDAGPIEEAGPIDELALDDLAELGGPDFVREVVDQFIDDSVGILNGLSRAVEQQDYRAFRDDLHALRSGAANVGARSVFQSCLKWREIAPDELNACGDAHLRELEDQLNEARDRLMQHIQRYDEAKEVDRKILKRA